MRNRVGYYIRSNVGALLVCLHKDVFLSTHQQSHVSEFAQDNAISSLVAAKLQRIAVTLAAYHYTLKHRSGKNVQLAQAL